MARLWLLDAIVEGCGGTEEDRAGFSTAWRALTGNTSAGTGVFYDADAKLDAAGEGTVTCTRAVLPAPVIDAVNGYAARLWDGLGCHGMARVDFIAAEDGTVAALEVNTTPGMSRDSNFAAGAGLLGLTHADILAAILREAITRPRYDAPLPVPDFSGRRM